MIDKNFSSFTEFYPYYLSEHSKKGTKILHFIGTFIVIVLFLVFLNTFKIKYLYLMPFMGYGFAWISHYFIEKNKPATFEYPFYSLTGDFLMFWHIITRKIKV